MEVISGYRFFFFCRGEGLLIFGLVSELTPNFPQLISYSIKKIIREEKMVDNISYIVLISIT